MTRRAGRPMRITTLVLAAILGLPALAAGADPPLQQRLDGLQEKYRCPITEYLLAIHRRPLAQKHRFLVLSPLLAEGYVQCLFFDKDRQIDCEAASGFYDPEMVNVKTPAKLAALAALGFSIDASAGNFVQQRPVRSDGALYDVAGMLVETLVRVYDFAAGDVLRFKAPLVPRPPLPGFGGDPHCSALIGRTAGGGRSG